MGRNKSKHLDRLLCYDCADPELDPVRATVWARSKVNKEYDGALVELLLCDDCAVKRNVPKPEFYFETAAFEVMLVTQE